jgi:hypothetical protein
VPEFGLMAVIRAAEQVGPGWGQARFVRVLGAPWRVGRLKSLRKDSDFRIQTSGYRLQVCSHARVASEHRSYKSYKTYGLPHTEQRVPFPGSGFRFCGSWFPVPPFFSRFRFPGYWLPGFAFGYAVASRPTG